MKLVRRRAPLCASTSTRRASAAARGAQTKGRPRAPAVGAAGPDRSSPARRALRGRPARPRSPGGSGGGAVLRSRTLYPVEGALGVVRSSLGAATLLSPRRHCPSMTWGQARVQRTDATSRGRTAVPHPPPRTRAVWRGLWRRNITAGRAAHVSRLMHGAEPRRAGRDTTDEGHDGAGARGAARPHLEPTREPRPQLRAPSGVGSQRVRRLAPVQPRAHASGGICSSCAAESGVARSPQSAAGEGTREVLADAGGPGVRGPAVGVLL
jgi:hypothetical protein